MRTKNRKAITLFLATAALAGTAWSVRAADPADNDWHLSITPLAWLPGIDGNVTILGRSVDLDVGVDKLVKHLDIGGAADFEVTKGKFGFYAQPLYMKLSGDGTSGPLTADAKLGLFILEGGFFYQVADWGGDMPGSLTAVAAARYWDVNSEITINGNGPLGLSFNGSQNPYLVDPVFGLRAQQYLTKKLSLNLLGNIGGFDISQNSSDFTWQATGTLGYDCTEHVAIYAGYSALSVRKKTGSGIDEKGLDLAFPGALVAVQIHW